MKIIISANFSLGDSLKEHTEQKLTHVIEKYFDEAVGADVNFKKQGEAIETSIVVSEGIRHGAQIRATSEEYDAYKSIDASIHKVEHQLREYKEKIKDHKHKH